jgi:hypothetical protein
MEISQRFRPDPTMELALASMLDLSITFSTSRPYPNPSSAAYYLPDHVLLSNQRVTMVKIATEDDHLENKVSRNSLQYKVQLCRRSLPQNSTGE